MSASLDLEMTAPDRPTILVVEDDAHIREVLSGLLGTLGYRLLMAASAEQALDALNVVSPDLVLTDVHLGAMSGIELCARPIRATS
jgi:CheY-like chemotaxis protein